MKLVRRCAVVAIVALGFSMAPSKLRTSLEGQNKIAAWEDCVSTPYYCPSGVLTVGIGSTGKVVKRPYSEAEIAGRWLNDMQHAENCINGNFEGVVMPQRAFEAMTDAAFNVGCPGLMWFTDSKGRRQRTTIWRQAQAHNWPAMCNRLTDFVNSNGKPLKGLINRRTDFQAWCRSDLGAK